MLKAFYEDYEGMYAKFRAWSEDVVRADDGRAQRPLVPVLLDEFLDRSSRALPSGSVGPGPGESDENRKVVAGVLDWARGKPDFLFADALKGLHEAARLPPTCTPSISARGTARATRWALPGTSIDSS